MPLARGRRAAGRAGRRLSRHRGARRAARVHAGADVADLPARHRRRQPDHPADQDPRRRRLVRAARDSALHPRRRADGVGRHLRAHRRSGDGHRRPRARRPRDGRGRRGDPVLGHLGIDGRRRVGDQLAARAVDAAGRLFGARVGQRRRGRVGDGHPGAAVPDDGRARIARQPVDRDAVPRRVRAGVRPGRGAARPDRAARAASELAGQPAAPRARSARARRGARPCRSGCRSCCSAASSAARRRSPRRRCSRSSTRSWRASRWAASAARARRTARAERHRDGHDAVGAGRRVGVRVDPGARVGAADARRMDRRRRRRPRRFPGADHRRSSSSSARCSKGCRRC